MINGKVIDVKQEIEKRMKLYGMKYKKPASPKA